MCCCSNKNMVYFFIKQLLSFGYSCGSLISVGLGLIKTFQRINAPPSFVAKLSPDCIKYFSWAQEIVNIFLNLVKTNPLNQFENYYLYTLVFPITILMIFSFTTNEIFIQYCFTYIVFCFLGFAIGMIKYNFLLALFLMAIPGAIIIIGVIFEKCKRSDCCCFCDCCSCFDLFFHSDNEKIEKFFEHAETTIFWSFSGPPLLIFYLLMIPIMISRTRLINVISILAGILSGLIVIPFVLLIFFPNCIIKILDCCDNKSPEFTTISNILVFITYILALLVVPSTNQFLGLMQNYTKDWRTIISYIAISILLPITIIFIMIKSNHFFVRNKYHNDRKYLYYIEILDMIRHLLYAILAYFDIIWYCLFSEIIWGVFILIIRPFQYKSEYFLQIGNCIITSITNIATIIAVYSDIKFNFAVSVILTIVAVFPAIFSMYAFFIKDLSFVIVENDEKESLISINKFIKIITPIAWTFYGLNLTVYFDKELYL